ARKGKFTAAQQAKAVQGVGRALTGSGMIAIAAAGALPRPAQSSVLRGAGMTLAQGVAGCHPIGIASI
ncbi:MAG: hypothetical protein SO145_04245, partial [Collinsella sp.]|nr:hypothetical protein [Collinsella sp.]